MDEISDKAVSTAVQTVMQPFMDVVSDVIGGVIGDPVKAWRRERPAWQKINMKETLERAEAELKRPDVGPVSPDAQPEHIIEILEAAAEESAPEIKELFGSLLAAAMSAKRRGAYRSEFVETVKKLEPLDAAVLMTLGNGGNFSPNQRSVFANLLKVSEDQIELSMQNLINSGCARDPQRSSVAVPYALANISLSPLGREIIRAVR